MYDNLEQLFYSGELEQCIEEGENYLLSHPDDEEVLFLMAVASHDQVYEDGHEAVYDAIREKVIPYLRRILKLNPDHQKALYNILSYPLENESTLIQIARPKKHITEQNKQEFITYAERLLEDSENAVYGYDFLVKIYESIGDSRALLNSLEAGIYYFEKHFADHRELRDKNISMFWIKKVYLLDREKKVSGAALVSLIEKNCTTFVSRNEYDFINLADIAYENEAPDLSLKIMLKVVKGVNSALHIQEKLAEWHQRFDALIQNGYQHPGVFYYQLIIERNYSGILNIAEDFYYHHALEIIHTYPELFSGYHFAGTYLYEEGRYSEAVPLLEKAEILSSNATAWRRKTVSEYHLYKTIPSQVPVFNDYPADLYNEGVHLDEFIEEINDENDKIRFQEVSQMIYQQAHAAFRRYYEDGAFESDYYNDLHTRAMCCNNLAIKYSLSGDHYSAIEVASEGLGYSEFRELHLVLIDALLHDENYEKAEKALGNYFALYDERDPDYFYKNLYYIARQIEVHSILGFLEADTEVRETLIYFYQHTKEHTGISDDDYADLEAAKNVLEGMIYQHLSHEENHTIRSYYENIAKRFPQEPNPQYVLMQIYNEQENYEKVALTAKSYLRNKKDFLLNDFDKAKTLYMIVKSSYLQGEYADAASVFSQFDASNEDIMDAEDYVLWLSYGIRAYGKLNNKDQTLLLSDRFSTLFNHENWEYDTLMEGVELARALVLYHSGNLKEAHAILDHVRSFSDYDAIADEYKGSWKKPGLLSKFGL
ncbi:MAG: hypothetical protein MUW56_00670 [Chryseobacterium sp.]|uniref:hypothetical protein n=1 Tax=Chryseobacterium sp. TaxID=1871047 RepID=UPI0025BDB1EA|nr:hypothetical protein [Chryseobacterium sp.]MCJ7932175.1 hypothetical protein [Chryseobacterium sp.]